MKIELKDNKVFFEKQGLKKEIHPFWLRERVNGENYVDKGTQQRLFDPTELKNDIQIENLNLSEDLLEVKFNDGVSTTIAVKKILQEFSNFNELNKIYKKNGTLRSQIITISYSKIIFLKMKKCIKL